jgi:hypothetical protein
MKSSHSVPAFTSARSLGWRGLSAALFIFAGFLTVSLSGQDTTPAAGQPADNGNGNNGNGRQRGNRGQGQGGQGQGQGQGGNFNPEERQAQMLENLRTQFDVADDAEWKVISDRLTVVNDLRRTQATGAIGAMGAAFGGGGQRGGGGGGGGGGRGGRAGANADPDLDALRQAIADKLPDGEIKARLERLRDSRKNAEAKLDKAREDLRAVLTVRQEAVAVMFGLLP